MPENNDPLEAKTRANIAYISIVGAMIMLGYIIFRWGDKMEILTLIIGIIGGTVIGGVFGVYFAGSITKKTEPSITNTGDSPTTTVNAIPSPTTQTT